jgi:single-strand DNA-binding protein
MTDARITLTGNIGRMDEIAAGQSGNLYLRFSVATTERVRDGDAWKDGDTSWRQVTAFGNTAEMAKESLNVGDPVIVYGREKVRQYEVNGESRISVDIVADALGLDLSRAKRKGSSSRQAPAFDPGTVPF